MKKTYIKLLAALLSLLILCGIFSPLAANADEENVYTKSFQAFLDANSHSRLLNRHWAFYMEYAELLRTDPDAVLAMNVLGFLYKTNTEPTKAQYKQALANILKTYEQENAEAITQQHLLDDNKELKDYLHDAIDFELSWLGVNGAAAAMGDDIQLALALINQMMKTEDDWANGVSALKTTLQNYENFDVFLLLIESQADGNLKAAAKELRDDLTNTMKARLQGYGALAMDSAKDYAKVFICEIFSDDWNKFIAEKLNNPIVNFFLTPEWKAAKLGVEIGKILGNLTVKAEDAIAYVVEIKAIYDISVILENQLETTKNAFLANPSSLSETEIQNYVIHGNYLISSRIRGQYCMSVLCLQTAGLNKLFGKDDTEKVENAYNQLTNNMLAVKKNLDAIGRAPILPMSAAVEADTIRYYDCKPNFNYCVIGKDGKYGLIDYSGNIVLPIEYLSIGLQQTSPSGTEQQLYATDSNGRGYLIEEDLSLTEGFIGGWGFENVPELYWYNEPVMFKFFEGKVPYSYEAYTSVPNSSNVLGAITTKTADVVPVQEICGYTLGSSFDMDGYTVKKVSEKYALLNLKTEELVTDFIFDDYNRTGFVEGILPVCKDGKWGYVKEDGQTITDFIYDASEVTPWGNNHMYSSLNNYIIVRQGDLWGLIDHNGSIVVDVAYEDISQVNDEGMFWLKEHGAWTLYQIQ